MSLFLLGLLAVVVNLEVFSLNSYCTSYFNLAWVNLSVLLGFLVIFHLGTEVRRL